jgi:hypothetical protein
VQLGLCRSHPNVVTTTDSCLGEQRVLCRSRSNVVTTTALDLVCS